MFTNKKDFLQLLADTGDCLKPENNSKPLKLQTACGNVLLHLAISSSNIKDVISLLKMGISVNSKLSEKDCKSALCRAVEEGFADIIDILVSHGADINEKTSNGMSFLHYAVSKGDFGMVDALISAGLEVDLKDHEGITALYRAAESDDIDTAEVLYDWGADIYTDSGVPLVHFAVSRNCHNAIRCFGDLNFDLDVLDSSQETALYQAAKAGNLEMAKALIENGSDLCTRDTEGNTLLHIATKDNNLTAMKIILDVGMDVNIEGGWWNWTPLHVAASIGNLNAAQLLLERKACVRKTTSDGRTALQLAKANGNICMINLLSSRTS